MNGWINAVVSGVLLPISLLTAAACGSDAGQEVDSRQEQAGGASSLSDAKAPSAGGDVNAPDMTGAMSAEGGAGGELPSAQGGAAQVAPPNMPADDPPQVGGSPEQQAAPSCAEVLSQTQHAKRGRSSGFAGTVDQYFELYDVLCESVEDCALACVERGGTDEMCAQSECLEGFPTDEQPDPPGDCLPPTSWRNFDNLKYEGVDTTDAVELVLVNQPYHDQLLADDLALNLPAEARVLGIQVDVRRSSPGQRAADEGVYLIKAGQVVGLNLASPELWTEELQWVSYGGEAELWGEAWTPEDVNAPEFGVALSALYTEGAGNGRAYVDQVRITIHYCLS